MAVGLNPKKKTDRDYKLNKDIEYDSNRRPNIDVASFVPRTRQELLALDLAKGLGDPNGLGLYLSVAHKYPESVLRRALAEIRELPADKIRKSRGALFNHIVQEHAAPPRHPRP